jgi:hypothetical protein
MLENALALQRLPSQLAQGRQTLESGALDLEEKRAALRDQQLLSQAYMQAEGNLDKTADLARRAGVRPKTLMEFDRQLAEAKTKCLMQTKEQNEIYAQTHQSLRSSADAIVEAYDGTPQGQAKASALYQQEVSKLPGLVQSGQLEPDMLATIPQTYPGPEGMKSIIRRLTSHTQQVNEALAVQRTATSKAQEEQAKVRSATLPEKYAEAVLAGDDAKAKTILEAMKATQKETAEKEPARDDRAIAIYSKPVAQRTPAENAYLKGYETYVEKTKVQPGILRIEALGETRGAVMLDTKNQNAPVQMNWKEINEGNKAEPGRYVPAGAAAPALTKTALLEDIRGNIDQVRETLQSMPDFGTWDRAKIAFALRSRDPRGSINALLSGSAAAHLSSQQQEYLIRVTNLIENAMAMRTVLGAGQGSEDMRSAITATIPGPMTPTKEYALEQLKTFEKVLNRLERGIPKVALRTDTGAGAGTTSPPPPAPGKIRVALPGGKGFVDFDNQAAAEAFKKDAGIP